MVPIGNIIAITRVMEIPVLSWGTGDWWYHSEDFLLFSPGGPSAEQGGRVLRKVFQALHLGPSPFTAEPMLCARDLADVTPTELMSGVLLASLSLEATLLPLNSFPENEASFCLNL